MSNAFLPRCAPIWGLPLHFTIADLPASYQQGVTVLTDVVTGIKSAAQKPGARSLEISFLFANGDANFGLKLYTVSGGVDTLVKTWTALTRANSQAIFAGNLEMLDLGGKPFKLEVTTPSDKVTVRYRVTS